MICDWSCSVREEELEQRVTVGQGPRGYSPRVPEQGKQSRSSGSNGGQSQ